MNRRLLRQFVAWDIRLEFRMKKKVFYGWIACIVTIGILLSVILGFTVESKKNQYLYKKIEAVIPGEKELKKHGIESESLFFAPQILAMTGVICFVCCGMGILCIKYTKKQDKKIEEMKEYCEKILKGNYSLDLRDNEEGQFSILKNKVYDITVMLNEQNYYLEQNKKGMEQMIADISHQLKTPITSLNMIHEILYMDLPEEKKIEFLDNMQKDLMKIEWLVKAVLNMAKLDSNTLKLTREEVQAAEFSREVEEHFHIFCEVNGCEIRVEGEREIQFLCDRKWTKEAVNNIVKNAMEHGAKMITLHWETNALYTMLQIADDGEGIEKKDLPHIFERFYRTKDSKEDSLGLGLAFAKSIMVHQNGDIRVRSKRGKGTVFTLKFYKNFP